MKHYVVNPEKRFLYLKIVTDSSIYFTWERFFTDLLERETSNNDITRYSKSKINEYYISERNIRKISEIAPKEIKSFLES